VLVVVVQLEGLEGLALNHLAQLVEQQILLVDTHIMFLIQLQIL
jgi:hypothetical protein